MFKNRKKKISKDQLFASLKLEVIKDLQGISNEEATFPILNHDKDISVRDLINEVEKETENGILYMIEYIATLSRIAKFNKSKNGQLSLPSNFESGYVIFKQIPKKIKEIITLEHAYYINESRDGESYLCLDNDFHHWVPNVFLKECPKNEVERRRKY